MADLYDIGTDPLEQRRRILPPGLQDIGANMMLPTGAQPRVSPMPQPISAQPSIAPVASPGPAQKTYLRDISAPPQAPAQPKGWKGVLYDIGQMFPVGQRIESMIPNTPANYQARTLPQFQQRMGIEKQAADEEQKQALDAAKLDQQNALATQERARAQAALNPPEKPPKELNPEEATIHDLMTGDNGNPRVNPDTGKPYTYLEAYQTTKQAGEKPAAPERPGEYKPYLVPGSSAPVLASQQGNKLITRDGSELPANAVPYEKPAQPPHTLMITPDGNAIEVAPGMTVPQGSRTATETGQLSADEQRRADMAENLNENLNQLEEILNRRGKELFGPIKGRETSFKKFIGSNDPDIGALGAIEDMLGRAMVSAHGMRSGGQVETAAQSILNSFKNGPDAVRRAIQDARHSVDTFTKDVEVKGGRTGASQPAPKGNWNPRTGRYE